MNMFQVCVFVPFLHLETPRPQNITKVPPLKDNIIPHADLINKVLRYRLKVGDFQKLKQVQLHMGEKIPPADSNSAKKTKKFKRMPKM